MGRCVKTTNGGETWEELNSPAGDDLYSTFFTDSNTGYVVGEGGTILKTTRGGGFPVIIQPEMADLNKLTIFPNPTSGKFTLMPPSKGHMVLSDLNGQPLFEMDINTTNSTLDVGDLPAGIYIIRLYCENTIYTGKIVKQ